MALLRLFITVAAIFMMILSGCTREEALKVDLSKTAPLC
jgi:hypothetical protein